MFLQRSPVFSRTTLLPVCFLQVFILCAFLASFSSSAQGLSNRKDTFSVFFPLDVSRVSAAAQKTLDSLRYREVLTPDKDLYVIGYADFVGRSSYNDTLSLRRATAVKEYLLGMGFKDARIRLVTGRGEIGGRDSSVRGGWAPDRRVDIAIAPQGFSKPVAATNRDTLMLAPRRVVELTAPKVVDSAPSLPVERLADIPINQAIVLRNLYFPNGRHYVYTHSYPALDALVNTLKRNASLRVRVEGHVCCIDPRLVRDALDEDTGEIALSVNRAKYIVEYLVRKGIARERLEYSGFGKTRPVAHPERTTTEAAANRRVEIRVLSR